MNDFVNDKQIDDFKRNAISMSTTSTTVELESKKENRGQRKTLNEFRQKVNLRQCISKFNFRLFRKKKKMRKWWSGSFRSHFTSRFYCRHFSSKINDGKCIFLFIFAVVDFSDRKITVSKNGFYRRHEASQIMMQNYLYFDVSMRAIRARYRNRVRRLTLNSLELLSCACKRSTSSGIDQVKRWNMQIIACCHRLHQSDCAWAHTQKT